MSNMFSIIFRYQAWANCAFFDTIERMDQVRHEAEFQRTMRLMNHAYVVSDIYAAHLTGREHAYQSVTMNETPSLTALRSAVATSDKWYLDYVHSVTPMQLAERIAFSFTDGDKGYMSREEMIMHVVMHSGYHRGEVGRILKQLSIATPWDTFAVFLHGSDPARREQGKLELAH
jgi:uncharacterized damage-inducible protein DinB